MVRDWTAGAGLRIAELGGVPVGASVILNTHPEHVPPTDRLETYLLFLVSDRTRSGLDIGAQFVRQAAAKARTACSEVLRVDCWAEAHDLVTWYERRGFIRSDTFTIRDDSHGQVFEMPL